MPDIETTLPPYMIMLPEKDKIQLRKEISTLFFGSKCKKLKREMKDKNINIGIVYLETIAKILGEERHSFNSRFNERLIFVFYWSTRLKDAPIGGSQFRSMQILSKKKKLHVTGACLRMNNTFLNFFNQIYIRNESYIRMNISQTFG